MKRPSEVPRQVETSQDWNPGPSRLPSTLPYSRRAPEAAPRSRSTSPLPWSPPAPKPALTEEGQGSDAQAEVQTEPGTQEQPQPFLLVTHHLDKVYEIFLFLLIQEVEPNLASQRLRNQPLWRQWILFVCFLEQLSWDLIHPFKTMQIHCSLVYSQTCANITNLEPFHPPPPPWKNSSAVSVPIFLPL